MFPKGYIRSTVILEVLILAYAIPAHDMSWISWLIAAIFPVALGKTWWYDSTPPSNSGRNNDRATDATDNRAGARAKPVSPRN